VRQINKQLLQIMYSLQMPYSRAKVEVITSAGTQTFYFTGNSNTIRQSFVNPITVGTEDITIKCYTVCDENTDPMDLGPATTVVLTINGNTLPVANNDTYNIAAGFNSAVSLSPSAMANDYDPDGDPIEIDAVVGGATNAGGTYSITSAGLILYTPPSSVYIGQDYFDYTLWETADHSAASTGRVFINVGTFLGNVYAKIVIRNLNISSYSYSSVGTEEVWIDFFSDPSASVPVDITSLGITANVDKLVFTQDNTGAQTNTHTTETFPCTGTKTKIFEGQFYTSLLDPLFVNPDEIYLLTYSMLPGTGYVPI